MFLFAQLKKNRNCGSRYSLVLLGVKGHIVKVVQVPQLPSRSQFTTPLLDPTHHATDCGTSHAQVLDDKFSDSLTSDEGGCDEVSIHILLLITIVQ